ncbi:GntR family transcriptional regulator [Streptomyces sp. NPDC091280]|uniref:GntR family transcriptional regulator n=1 Tax=Streptomyces sp. NPDC091280 TaxID=3365984 RepID=UPI00381E6508
MRAHEAFAEVLRQRIADGTYPLGSVFPTLSVLKATSGHLMDDVRRARRTLVREGLLESPPGDVLTFVRGASDQPVPHYKQEVANVLRRRIHDRVYPPGTQFPAATELAREFRVGPIAMRCAVNQLCAEGHLETRGRRTYVTTRAPSPDPAP